MQTSTIYLAWGRSTCEKNFLSLILRKNSSAVGIGSRSKTVTVMRLLDNHYRRGVERSESDSHMVPKCFPLIV
ncbi:hypothetical protein RRG08_039408 [Elysia crispata]|nr:hypothetical protein RRG08_039408 [Elysia crispata]